jgi:MFS-type transporter involved in bile tolerance (Atg22 family)
VDSVGGITMSGVEGVVKVAEKTNNDILLLFVVVAIVILLVAIPFYKIYSKAEAEKRTQALEREENILNVIKENTSVNSSIKTLLEANSRGCESCKREQMTHFKTIEMALTTLLERGNNHV